MRVTFQKSPNKYTTVFTRLGYIINLTRAFSNNQCFLDGNVIFDLWFVFRRGHLNYALFCSCMNLKQMLHPTTYFVLSLSDCNLFELYTSLRTSFGRKCKDNFQFQIEIWKIVRPAGCVSQRGAEKYTRIYNAHIKPLLCSSNLFTQILN